MNREINITIIASQHPEVSRQGNVIKLAQIFSSLNLLLSIAQGASYEWDASRWNGQPRINDFHEFYKSVNC